MSTKHYPELSMKGRSLWLSGSLLDWRALKGDALLLGEGVRRQQVPIGILLDRLTEHPEECDASAAELEAAISQLRERNPNGNESNW